MTGVLGFTPWGFQLPLPSVLLGTIIGITYGLLAVGLVLIYRSNRIINFAHGEIGAFGAACFGLAVTRWHVPYYLALPIALAVAGGAGAAAEVGVVRRLRNAPRLMSIVATLGVGQFLLFFGAAVGSAVQAGALYPSPPGLPEFTFGALRVTRAYTGMLVFGPIVVLVLALFLRRSRYGLGIRCAAANPEAARMAGISANRMSSLSWAIAGAVSAFTAILVLPSRGFTTGEAFGPSLLLRALTGAVLARMNNLPAALAGGVALGITEQLLLWNSPRGSIVEVVLFVVILVTLLVQRGSIGGRSEERGSWAAVQGLRPLPEAARRLFAVRYAPLVVGGPIVAVAALLPLVITNANASTLTGIYAFTIVGLSVGIVTGLAGQLSLGQFGLAAIGAAVSFHVASRAGSFTLSFLYAGLAAAAVSLFIGLPALRIRGLMLTVTTLGFALVTANWVLTQSWMLGNGVSPGRPHLGDRQFETGKAYYFVGLLALVLMYVLARNIRTSGFGRLLVAVRDNEDNARAFTVRARTVKLQAFLLSGFVAGIGGAVYGHLLSRITVAAFPVKSSIDVVAMTVLGGIGILSGPLLGALYILGIPKFLPLDSAGLAATQLGWLVLILYLPGGIAQLAGPVRDRLVVRLARRQGIDLHEGALPAAADDDAATVTAPSRSLVPIALRPPERLPRLGKPLLEARDLRKTFGGVTAVDSVSLQVGEGETLGLIGPNGAGKTTTFELLSGFTRPNSGIVLFDGEDVSLMGPEDRARLGLIRSFQDAGLFPTLTVHDSVRLAFERIAPTSFLGSALGLRRGEARKDVLARELIGAMGLDRYRTAQIQELSTGTRRITEIACLIALQPVLLLLDEPSSGIAQRETEALGNLLDELKRELGLTLVVIEHDIPLIMGLADRVVAMDAGRVIADGTPAEVRADPLVIEAYLGGNVEAIERSNSNASPRRRTAP